MAATRRNVRDSATDLARGAPPPTVARLPGVDPVIQRASTGRIEGYAAIEEKIAPEVLQVITG
jgi:hypothetical protein